MRGHRPYVGAQDDHRAAGSKQKIQIVMDRWLGGLSRPRCVSLRHRNRGRIHQRDGQSRTTTKLFDRVQYGFYSQAEGVKDKMRMTDKKGVEMFINVPTLLRASFVHRL